MTHLQKRSINIKKCNFNPILPYRFQREEIQEPCSHDFQVGAGGRSQESPEKGHTRLYPVSYTHLLVIALGAGLGVWGVVNLLEGYVSDNPGSNAHVR